MLILITNDIKCLKGKGTEILTDAEGNFIAEFYNGNMICGAPQGNTEITKIAA